MPRAIDPELATVSNVDRLREGETREVGDDWAEGTLGVRRANESVTQTGRGSLLAPDTRNSNAGAGLGASSLAASR